MVKILTAIILLIALYGCATHQDLLAPEHPGPMSPVNDQLSDQINKEKS